jgi:hypothetical protein
MEFREERVRITLHCSDQKKLTWGRRRGQALTGTSPAGRPKEAEEL